ncbi:hypothetical protein MARA_00610 (plasmid) [Mycolicibacterium arabiense]|uniref:Uncharacterized protein n=1 Tax=Mycolicibacterium arabiense TaxID=1286181 RepID=A0A7I7RQY9_9MYCO|nr:hypothetical protein [Mycolicibacterium arabiense]BBY46631.1 hypothetical protein MARA_00610 [Mycolicibacterium arabiense]
MPASEDAWGEFDRIVDRELTDPWTGSGDARRYVPDVETFAELLEVPLQLELSHTTGLPAKAVDVWLSYELRRAGFGADEVWPRPRAPRVLPREVTQLLEGLPRTLREQVASRIASNSVPKVGSSDAKILGRAYEKQVDVVMARWSRGPELLVSTKRMDRSLSNNAFNRIEESYGDAHNLRGRHPLAALGYVMVLRSSVFDTSAKPALRLVDLIARLGAETGLYDATSVVVASWNGGEIDIDAGEHVSIGSDPVPAELAVDRFLMRMVDAVLDRTPVTAHVRARELRRGEELVVDDAD